MDELAATISDRVPARKKRVLRTQLGSCRLFVGRKLIGELSTIVTRETLLRWHRNLIACKYDGSEHRNPGRPATAKDIEEPVVRMAKENRSWGYLRIRGALSNLGHEVGRNTIASILKRNGIESAPDRVRKTTWKEFLTQHWELLVAADFFTVEVWTPKGLQRFFVLFFIELSTRRVQIAGISAKANGFWMNQIARNLTDTVDGPLNGKRYLIHDRDPLFTVEFLSALTETGVESVKLPPRSPT
jgi:hypothetical protein